MPDRQGSSLDGGRRRNEAAAVPFLTSCAWCRRVRVGERWLAESAALRALRTFESAQAPLYTHGICTDCLAPFIADRGDAASSAPLAA